MALFFSMLPFYLIGNLHCIGMCGPLVMMIGQHRFRYYYFLGRVASFGFAGLLAGAAGAILQIIFKPLNLSGSISLFFGSFIFAMGALSFFGGQFPGAARLSQKFSGVGRSLSLLILRDTPWPTFLFGFFTVALPCGQTLIVFSACALSGDAGTGLLNGVAFALLTSPSLFFAMQAHGFLKHLKVHYNKIMGACAMVIGLIAFCRGLADIEYIPHFILNQGAASAYHIVLF